MKFVSTRSGKKQVSFSQAILHCLADDGGLYVPAYAEDLHSWIMYMDEKTSFQSVSGTLTSALIKEEFSPIISEAIASRAFPFSPELKKLDNNLYVLELFHGPTGIHKDFGISYLAACLEHILLMQEKNALIVAPTSGETGASIVHALKNKKHIKAVLLYAKGTMRGFNEDDCVWNGGNVYPIEVDGGIDDCINLERRLYADVDAVNTYNLTLANTINIGRLLPHTFLYMYAFSRLRKQVYGDIFYTMSASNYGNLAAGLYGWKFSLPVHGFITNCTAALSYDVQGKCCMPDSIVPLEKRGAADPALPSNIERLEQLFATSPAVMKGLVYTAQITCTPLGFLPSGNIQLFFDKSVASRIATVFFFKNSLDILEGAALGAGLAGLGQIAAKVFTGFGGGLMGTTAAGIVTAGLIGSGYAIGKSIDIIPLTF